MPATAKTSPDPLHDILLEEGIFHGTTDKDLAAAFQNLGQNFNHLCVFFHGGLVDESSGLDSAHRLAGNYGQAGAYPLFFIWRSGLLDALKALLRKHADSPAFNAGAYHAVTLVAAKINAALDQEKTLKSHARRKPKAGTLKALEAFAEPYDQAWATRTSAVQLGCSSSELDQFARFLIDADKIRGKRPPPTFLPGNLRGEANPLSRILHRFNTGHDHGLYTTVIEELFIALRVNELAGLIWNEMKVLIEDSFKDDSQAGGTAFLNHLCELWKGKPNFRVTLIGHSAGSIYVQRFLEELDARLPGSSTARVEVILVAAAMTFERMYQGLAVWPRRVSGLRVFAMDDFREGNYWEVPLVYDKSLLYIVSGLCEVDKDADKPLVGMQRYWTRGTYEKERAIHDVIGTIGNARSVWSKTPAKASDGYRSQATRHGGFPEDTESNQSICLALKKGF
jgi:hypothetical protein